MFAGLRREEVSAFSAGIPKVICSLWLQGQDKAPDLVRLNFSRWATLNPHYRLRILDCKDVDLLLKGSGLPIDTLTPQALSDVLRTRVLLDEGGIWTDASVLPIRPLDDWIPGMLTKSGFFAFERPAPDRLLSSWFLASTPANLILREWWKEIERYWSKPRKLLRGIPADPMACVSPEGAAASDSYPYFWFHYLFQYLVENRPEVAELWSGCVKSPADLPLRLQRLFKDNKRPGEQEIRQAAGAAPLQKLNWRASYPLGALASLTCDSFTGIAERGDEMIFEPRAQNRREPFAHFLVRKIVHRFRLHRIDRY
jgi:hypothetical protein